MPSAVRELVVAPGPVDLTLPDCFGLDDAPHSELKRSCEHQPYVAQAVPAEHRPLDGVLPWAIDSGAAERLWALSEQLTDSR